jgi:hypothetical protein
MAKRKSAPREPAHVKLAQRLYKIVQEEPGLDHEAALEALRVARNLVMMSYAERIRRGGLRPDNNQLAKFIKHKGAGEALLFVTKNRTK